MAINPISVRLDNRIIDDFVHNDLNSFSQLCEDTIWDWYVDNISFTCGEGVLNEFNIRFDNIENFINRNVKIYYYDREVFEGRISEVDYDDFETTVNFTVDSIGKIISNFTIPSGSSLLQNENRYGDDLYRIGVRLLTFAQEEIRENRFPFVLRENVKLSISDFPPLRTINMLNNDILPNFKNALRAELRYRYRDVDLDDLDFRGGYERISDGKRFLCWTDELIREDVDGGGVSTSGMNIALFAGITEYGYYDFDLIRQTEIGTDFIFVEDENDEAYKNVLKNNLNLRPGDGFNYKSQFSVIQARSNRPNSNFIHYRFQNTDRVAFLQDTDSDKIIYSYEDDTTIADILKDVATLTNTIVGINPDGEIVFVSRDFSDPVINCSAEPERIKVAASDTLNENFELPEAMSIYLTKKTKADIIEYYRNFLKQKTKKYTMTFKRTDLDFNNFPFILKTILIPYKGLCFEAGVIKEISYNKNTIDVVTEKYIGA